MPEDMVFNLEWKLSKREVEELGGKEKVEAMLQDILGRYANEEYFDQEILLD